MRNGWIMGLYSNGLTRAVGVCFAFALFGVVQTLAQSAPGPAVSGPNGKFSVEGGEYDNEGSFLAKGSYSLPLGHAFGLQMDGALGRIDDELMGGGGVHLFTRKPEKYLFGFYGSYHTWDGIDIWRAATEFEVYLDRFSLTGLAGIEGIEFPTTDGGLQVLHQDDEHFFGYFDAAYYLTDNLKISAGYRYISEAHLGAASIEYLIRSSSIPISLFAQGHFGEEEFNRITGGVKIYFGADQSKSLMSRHRTEDPQNYTPVFPDLATASQSTPAPPE